MTFVVYDVCHIMTYIAYDVCRIMTLVGYDVIKVFKNAYVLSIIINNLLLAFSSR